MSAVIRRFAAAAVIALLLAGSAQAQATASAPATKVLKYAFSKAETGFDPAQLSDLYSRIVTAHIFEAPLTYDHLARPYELRPATAAALPEVSADFKTFTFRIKPGIYFTDDAAFGGKKRELVAQDYVYSLKRLFDPKLKSPTHSNVEEEGILGLQELREAALKSGKPFEYDREIEGLRALDRYTLQVRLREPRPRHLYVWASPDIYGAVAREVVEAYGDNIMAHPVGTGPYRLTDWRRSSRIVLQRNPGYRDDFYDAHPNADDAYGQALLKRFKGKRLPMIDQVEISIIEEAQPRWLAFLNGEQNFLDRVPEEFISQAAPGGKLAPNLAKRRMQLLREPGSDITLTVFNMEDPMIGGYTPAQVALRRAMTLGDNMAREIDLARYGQAIPAQSIMTPMTTGYRSSMRTEMSVYNMPRAKALLDLYGFVDRDGDGWRERPDGKPLKLEVLTESAQATRRLLELWKKCMDEIGVRAELKVAQWPENLKATRSGKFMMWRVGSLAATPDGQGALERAYGPSVGKANLARFRNADFDRVYDQLKLLPDGPERLQLFDEATKLLVAYVPYRLGVHRIYTDMAYPELIGYKRAPFSLGWWPYADIVTP